MVVNFYSSSLKILVGFLFVSLLFFPPACYDGEGEGGGEGGLKGPVCWHFFLPREPLLRYEALEPQLRLHIKARPAFFPFTNRLFRIAPVTSVRPSFPPARA